MLNKIIYLLILGFAFFDCQASTINFDELQPFSNYSAVPESFGSTPEVSVFYQTLNSDGTVESSNVLLWNAGYADLNTAAFANANGRLLNITLTAVNPNNYVTLSSFEVGGYLQTSRDASDLRIVDGNDITNILIDYAPLGNPFTVPGDVAYIFEPNITASSIGIILGTSWNLGINNITFSTTPVPLPAAFWFFGSALASLGVFKKGRSFKKSV
ncbi:hypothetical protein [Methylotuvimicrobium sp. KM1]|uniref:hypothetical protein n=1 Tax=Methylotuvimicrobium sp. KM1 TaxID=3377707 RepID=UPI00384B01D7